jgi:hypothetical protein
LGFRSGRRSSSHTGHGMGGCPTCLPVKRRRLGWRAEAPEANLPGWEATIVTTRSRTYVPPHRPPQFCHAPAQPPSTHSRRVRCPRSGATSVDEEGIVQCSIEPSRATMTMPYPCWYPF